MIRNVVSPSVLIISPFFSPEPISTGKYNTALAEALVSRGCSVTVLCSHPLYPNWRPERASREPKCIVTIRGGLWVRYPKFVFLRRIILELWFSLHVAVCSMSLRNKFDIVIPVFPPNLHFLMATVFLGTRAVNVGIVHDLQGIHAAADAKGLFACILQKTIGLIESLVFSCCHRLIVLSHSMLSAIGHIGKCCHVSVCYPFCTIDPSIRIGRNLVNFLPDGITHVVYSGALGKKQNPAGLLLVIQAAAIRMPHVWFHIFSEGHDFNLMRQCSEGLPNVYFRELVSENDLSELYSRSDLQIIPQAFGTEAGAMPSKLPNIVAGGCAIFAICSEKSEVAELLDRHDLGIISPDWDADFAANIMERFLLTELPAWKARSASAKRRDALALFHIDNLVETVLSATRVGR